MKEFEEKPRFKNTIHLWEFLMELLNNERYASIIEWTSKEKGEFKLKRQEEVARQWGLLKQRKGMTYDKLSRSLRYYYNKKIITKVSGQKLVYKFHNLPFEYLPLRNMDQTTRRKQLQGQINKPFPTPIEKPYSIQQPSYLQIPRESPARSTFEGPRPSVIRSTATNTVLITSPPCQILSSRVMSKSQIIFPSCEKCTMTNSQ